MNARTEDYQPLPVHLASAAPGISLDGAPRAMTGRRRIARLNTIVLDATEPCKLIAPADEDRVQLWILPEPTTKCIVGMSKGEIGGYADTTFAYPPGLLILPSSASPAIPVHTTEALWAASPAATGATHVIVRVIMISEPEEAAD